MRHLLALLLGAFIAFNITTMNAQVGIRVGATGGNIGDDYATNAAIIQTLGVNYQKNLVSLFTVQGDNAKLAINTTLDLHHHKDMGVKVLPSVGVKLDFPLFVEYGVTNTFGKLKTYFESGAKVSDAIHIIARLHNFNINHNGDLHFYNWYTNETVKLKRSITLGIKINL